MNDTAHDPLSPILRPAVRPAIETVLRQYAAQRRYRDKDFPMNRERFARFRRDVRNRLVRALGLSSWRVPRPSAGEALRSRFNFRRLRTIDHHGVRMEVGVIEIPESGEAVAAVLCLPRTHSPRPGICTFSGHSPHGLRDMVVDLDSYQAGIAARLAQSGFVSIAVEKVDAGYHARGCDGGSDEREVATMRLALGDPTRSRQLMACIAAAEVLAAHPRVDSARIGATGVSLGGWLSIETALLSARIRAVADFGKKTRHVYEETEADAFHGIRDLCHIEPGMLSVCDRNLVALACCPLPMLAGHGRQDADSHAAAPRHFRALFESQYNALGKADAYEYHVHGAGDDMPADAVIDYFTRRFC